MHVPESVSPTHECHPDPPRQPAQAVVGADEVANAQGPTSPAFYFGVAAMPGANRVSRF
jgi:hypothetical protein